MKKLNLLSLLPLLMLTSCQSNTFYTITFALEDGTVIQTTQTRKNEVPEFSGEIPTKESTVKYNFTFSGWEPEIGAAKGDTTYTAVFESVLKQYLIEWLDYDFSVIESTIYDYGKKPTEPENVTKSYEDDYYTYTFAGWDGNIKKVTANHTYKAVYTQTKK